MEKTKLYKIYFIGFVLFIAILTYLYIRGYNRLKKFEINGIVDKVSYDEKGSPDVHVNGMDFYLGGPWNFKHLIEAGDSLTKKKDDMVIRLVKKGTGEVIMF